MTGTWWTRSSGDYPGISEYGIFHGIGMYRHGKTRARTGSTRLIDNRVGVAGAVPLLLLATPALLRDDLFDALQRRVVTITCFECFLHRGQPFLRGGRGLPYQIAQK